MKLLFLVLRHAAKAWKMPPREFIILEDRFFAACWSNRPKHEIDDTFRC
jgi:hypothetical protein